MGFKEVLKNKLESLMRQGNLTNEILAVQTGISRSSINRIRMNKGNPTLETLHALCDFFKISIQELTSSSPLKSSPDSVQGLPLVAWNNLAAEINKMDNALCAVVTPQEYTNIPKSSLIYIDKNRKPTHGDYVLVIDKEQETPHVAEYIQDMLTEYVRSCIAPVQSSQALIPLNKFQLFGVVLEARKIFIPAS